MTNWVPIIDLIKNGERVNEANVGRVTGGLKQRTDFLFERLNNLQVENLIFPGLLCASTVSNNLIGYLNPVNGLIELADGSDTTKVSVIGVILNKRAAVGGFQCDLLVKGQYKIPSTELATFIEEGTWSRGETLFLSATTLGKATFIPPILSVPLGIALEQDSNGDYPVFFDSDSYLNLQHRHVREVFTWIPTTSGGTGAFTLSFEPTLPSSVFALVDANPLSFDDAALGSWSSPGDPDFTVSGTTLQIYTPVRFEVNPFLPKLEVWYSTPFGNSGGVLGLVAGHNIDLSSCNFQGQIASGVVTVNSIQQLKFLTDNSLTSSIKKIEIDPTDKALVITQGENTNKILPGIGIYFTDDTPEGQGNFTVNARPNRDSFEFLEPDSIFLDNSKQKFLFDRFHVHSLEAGDTQEATILFRVPSYANVGVAPELIFEHLIDSQDPSDTVELSIEALQMQTDSTLADATATNIFTSSLSIDFSKFKTKQLVSIPLGFTLIRDSSLILAVKRTGGVLDTYGGNFNILHTRLRFVPDAI